MTMMIEVDQIWYDLIERCLRKRHTNGKRARKCIHETANRYTKMQAKQGADYRKVRRLFFMAMKKRFGDRL